MTDIQTLATEVAALLRKPVQQPTIEAFYLPGISKITVTGHDQFGRQMSELFDWRLVYSEQDQREMRIAADYFLICDAYDADVCTGRHPDTGEVMPVSSDELRAVNLHADWTVTRLAVEHRVSRLEIHQSIARWPRSRNHFLQRKR